SESPAGRWIARSSPSRRPRFQIAYVGHGNVGVRAHCFNWIRPGQRLASGAGEIWLALSHEFGVESGKRTVRRAAVHLRNVRFFAHRVGHRSAFKHGHGNLSHRTRATLDSATAD